MVNEGELLKPLKPEDFDFEMIPVIRESLGVRFKHDAFVSIFRNGKTGQFKGIRCNLKARAILEKYGSIFFGFYDKEQNCVGLQQHSNGSIFLKNHKLSGIKKLLNNFNPDNVSAEVYKVIETSEDFKKMHNIDVVLVPYNEQHFWLGNETLGEHRRKHKLETTSYLTDGRSDLIKDEDDNDDE